MIYWKCGILFALLLSVAAGNEDAAVASRGYTSPPVPSKSLNCWEYCDFVYPYYNPVCASDKQTYYNRCYLDCENEYRQEIGLKPLWFNYEYACIHVYCSCPSKYAPVCDEFGNSYYNHCYLDCANRQSQQDGYGEIGFQHGGLCAGDSCACPFIADPLCAFDGIKYETFGSPCLLNCENARRQNQNLPLMKKQYPGECKGVVVAKKCTDECKSYPPYPMCGTNNVTYINICYLNCASLEAIQNGKEPIFIAKIGPC